MAYFQVRTVSFRYPVSSICHDLDCTEKKLGQSIGIAENTPEVDGPQVGSSGGCLGFLNHQQYVGVSKDNGTPKSSILIGCSIINHPFWGTPIFGNIHVLDQLKKETCGKIANLGGKNRLNTQTVRNLGRSSSSAKLVWMVCFAHGMRPRCVASLLADLTEKSEHVIRRTWYR